MADRLIHTRAGKVGPGLLGHLLMVRADETRTIVGGLSDYQHLTPATTTLWLGGHQVTVSADTVVTNDLRGVTS